ncbi:MAG: peptidase T, partial [Planctomycetales bacterium]|nr:peptidase T [Planctomycetales bacterium]
MVNSERLLERFLRYVQADTTADESSSEYPSSPGQRTLGAMIADELRGLRLENVEHDANGLVWATVPGNVEAAPTVAFNAHLDTSPETSGT